VFVLSSKAHFANMDTLARGTTMQRISRSALGRVRFALPPTAEQTQIANFLVHETSKIDGLVEDQRILIELLKEKRQAVISQAVTKGLNPNVPMKDSGVDWLGTVPAHWTVSNIKHIVATPVTDGPHETPNFADEGIPFVSAEAVSSGVLDFEKKRGYISVDDHQRYSMKYRPRRGDIYMIKSGATTGVTAIVETDDDFNIWSPLAVIRCDKSCDPYFVLNFMRSKNFLEAVTLNWSFGTQQNIGMGVIENLAVPVPPLSDQRRIASMLGDVIGRLDALMEEVEEALRLLQERRSALISAAVTGKIDVRGLVPQPEAVDA
jgi:type I restriction enzyme S subunit